MADRPTKEKQPPKEIQPEPIPVYVRSHTRVKNEKPRKESEGKLADKWANYALVFDCETTIDIRQDLNFLWWRFCERKQGNYICQREGLVHADALDRESIALIHRYANVKGRKADVEEGCPEDILVQPRTDFVHGEFWTAVQAGAVIVCFNAPFDLSRLALEYREARKKNSDGQWSSGDTRANRTSSNRSYE